MMVEKSEVRINKTLDPTASEPLKYKVVSDEMVELDHDLATRLLDMKTFQGERDVRDEHVQELWDEHKRGRFLWEHVILASCRVGVRGAVEPWYRINGQHTCWMRLNLPKNLSGARVRYIQYEVTDMEQLRRLYGVFDRNKARTHTHIVRALLAGTEQMEGVSESVISKLASGMKLWLWENRDQNRRMGPHEVALAISGEYASLFVQVAKWWQDNQQFDHLKRAAAFAAMFATFHKVPSKAVEFWQPVADGLHLDSVNDARHRLRHFLINARVDRAVGKQRVVDAEGMFRICINAWNRWRKSEPTQNLRTTERRMKPI